MCAPGDNEAIISIPQKNAANSDHAPINQATKPSLTDAQVQHVASLDQLSQTSLAKGNVLAGGAASEYTNTILPDTHCPEITTFKRVENVNPDPRNVSTISDHKESLDTKYDLPLKIKQRINYKSKLSTCSTLRHWDSQNKFKFGYIPLGDLHLPPEINSQTLDIDPLSLHKIIKQSGNFNFLKAQITVSSQLKPDVWDTLLQDYWDKQLCSLIRFGFPLDFDRNISLESHLENHFSAKAYPQDIEAYLQEEISHEAILGPFNQPPIQDLHVSPFMTREKPNAPHRRVIIDLSFPQGKSVNTGIQKDTYLNTPFILKLPTIDTITNQIKSLGRGCMLYKIDLSRAFRHVKLDPGDYDLLGLRHVNWYVNTCLPFGYRNRSAIFQRLSDAVHHIMRRHNFDIINYIDDVIGIDVPSRIDASFDALYALLHHLGFEVSQKKLVHPSTVINCLGILLKPLL